MELIKCQESLKQAVFANPSISDNISKITKIARGTQKADCLEQFGSASAVRSYITSLPADIGHSAPSEVQVPYTDTTYTEPNTDDETNSQTTTSNGPSFWEFIGFSNDSDNKKEIKKEPGIITTTVQGSKSNTNWLGSDWMEYIWIGGFSILGIFVLLFCVRIFRYLFSFIYDVSNHGRIKYMSVTLPRGDSRGDREKEKDIAKDMKEKIARMTQVFRNLRKLGELSVRDNVLRWFFNKPKIVLIMHYEKGMVNFIIGTYPEYMSILQSAISAQYPDASIETVLKPDFFGKKYNQTVPIEPLKDTIFPIKLFKLLEDDPLNNLVDTIGKFSAEDTFSFVISIKPIKSNAWNKRAKKRAEGLYRNDSQYVNPPSFGKILLKPFGIFGFLFKSPDTGPNAKEQKYVDGGKDFVRMVKPQEDAINAMAEESGKPPFASSVMLASSSDQESNVMENIRNMIGTLAIYRDEFNNELDQNEFMVDIFGGILKPLWRIALNSHLINFFFRANVFTENSLTSIFHFPDWAYNRSPAIRWMDYKVLTSPDNIYQPKVNNEKYRISGSVAEGYLGGKIQALFADSTNPNIYSGEEITETMSDYDTNLHKDVPVDQIIEKNGKKMVKIIAKKHKTGIKIYKDALLMGINVYRNKFTPVYINKKDRSRHYYTIGKSGGGKSVNIGFMARQDAWNGEGFCVIDPHGDLVEDILKYIPAERAKDVVYFDAGNEERPMGLNLYDIKSKSEADRVVNDATEMFIKMFGPEVFGPRLQEYFKFGSLTLLEDLEEGATFLDIPRLFTDEGFRTYKTKKVTNPVVRNFRERTYASIGDREKEEIIPYLTAKFVSFTTNSLIRNIIGQTKSAFNFREIMDQGKILLVNLSKGKTGELNSQLLGMIIVSQINNGAMSRADIPEDQRRDFYLYVDEFQNFISNTFANILSEARKYHLALIMAHQYIAQLDGGGGNNIGDTTGSKKSVKDAVFGNVGTIQSFKVGAPDAEFLEKEYAPVLGAQDIIGISNYKTYTKLNINNATSRVFSIDTIWSQDYQNEKLGSTLKQYSALKYGREKQFVESEIAARIGIDALPPEDPIVGQTGDNLTDTSVDTNTDQTVDTNTDTNSSNEINTNENQPKTTNNL